MNQQNLDPLACLFIEEVIQFINKDRVLSLIDMRGPSRYEFKKVYSILI